MIGERMKFLLLEASKCFDDGYSPFNDEWLSEHNVTVDECAQLSVLIGMVLSGVALADKETQAKVVIASVQEYGKSDTPTT